jgi:uncharacterized protein involved in outer membrane biogenesis
VPFSPRTLTAIAGVAALILLILFSLPIAVDPRIKQRLVNALGERFDSEVQLATLTVSFLPRPRLSGQGLVLRHKYRTDVPPLVTIASFSGEAGLVGLLSDPLRVSNIHLEGLEINVPPGGVSLNDDEPEDADDNDREASPLIVDNLQSERAVLRILRRNPDKAPRVFEIAQLDMKDVGADHPWPFRANLTNPATTTSPSCRLRSAARPTNPKSASTSGRPSKRVDAKRVNIRPHDSTTCAVVPPADERFRAEHRNRPRSQTPELPCLLSRELLCKVDCYVKKSQVTSARTRLRQVDPVVETHGSARHIGCTPVWSRVADRQRQT